MRFGALLRRGVAAGAAAGIAAALVMWIVVEPVIRRALVIEEARGGHHHGGEEPLVSRALQVVGGTMTTTVAGILFGVVFAVVFAAVRHRLPGTSDYGRALVLASLGYAVFALLPGLKFPANPPAVGDPATVTERTLLYVLSILLGLLIVTLVSASNRHLKARGTAPAARHTLNLAVAVSGVAAVFILVPGSPDTVRSDIPATLLWEFRVASLGQLMVICRVLGVVFGLLTQREAASRRDVALAS